MRTTYQMPRSHELNMNFLNHIIQRCHQRHKSPLRQRKTKVTPALYKDLFYHFTVQCAWKYPVRLYELEQAGISFMPIGRAPHHDYAPPNFGGERFLKRQGTRDWKFRRWFASWGIQVYTGTPSERDGAQWHDIDFTYDAICVAPDAVLACIESLINAIANPLLTMTKSGGLRFSCRVQDYLHPNIEEAKQYIHKHAPTAENPYHRDVYLEIQGAEGYSCWDARYEILLGNLLDPPVIFKEVLFAIINELRAVLHESVPTAENSLGPTSQATTVSPVVPTPIGEKVVAVREGKLSPLAIKRPSPVLYKSEDRDSSRRILGLRVLEHDEKTGWLCAVNEAGMLLPFHEVRISKSILDAWSANEQQTALRSFARALLYALENRSELYENPVGRVRVIMRAFEGQQETLIQQMREERKLWDQLKQFFAHYPRNEDAPIIWDRDMLRFWVPSAPDAKRVHPNGAKNAESKPWLAGNRVFQIRTGIYLMHQILNYENSWDSLGFSEIGKRFFDGIHAEVERDPTLQHTVVCGERLAKWFRDTISLENVRYLSHIKRVINVEIRKSIFESSDVIWIVGAPYWPPHLMWKQAQVLFGTDAEPLCYDVDMDSYRYKDERIQELCEQNVTGILTQLVDQVELNRLPNKTVVLLTAMPLPDITDRSETLLCDWEDFEVADGLDKLSEVIAERQRFETERDNLTSESTREKVEQVLGISKSQANRVLMKLRGGKIQRVPFQDQIHSLLESGEKRTAELIAAIKGHPGAVKNELKRLVDSGEIVKVSRGVYALPKA